MAITPLPTPPSRTDGSATFVARADAFLGALPAFASQANALEANVNAKATSAESAASTATSKASTATTKASEAAASASAAAASYDAFDDRYLGSKATNPTTDNDGNTLLTGALYWNSADGEMRVWNGSIWLAAYVPEGSNVTLTGVQTLSNKTLVAPKLDQYTLGVGATTTVLNLALQQVFRVDATAARTLTFSNAPGADRAMTVVVRLIGNAAVTWPAGIAWAGGVAPTLGASWTTVVVLWDGTGWYGSAGAKQ